MTKRPMDSGDGSSTTDLEKQFVALSQDIRAEVLSRRADEARSALATSPAERSTGFSLTIAQLAELGHRAFHDAAMAHNAAGRTMPDYIDGRVVQVSRGESASFDQ
jgi:hypothetical protein